MEGLFQPIVSDEENEQLIVIPSEEEISITLMPSLKACGPDGMSPIFYKHYWHIIKTDFFLAIQSFFRNGYLLKQWNSTFITLIPKTKGACTFKDFRPISLTNLCYKVISPNQTTFIEGIGLWKMV